MWPTTLIQLLGAVIYCAALVFGALQGWKWYLNTLEEKAKSKDQVEIAKLNAQIAKEHAEILTASQVTQLMKSYEEVKKDVEQIKQESERRDIVAEERDEQLTKAMDKLENNLRNFEDMFQKFLIARVNQFEQTLKNFL
jgi:restriction endonuclease Mrr